MTWIGWVAAAFAGLVLADVIFISAIIIADWIHDRRRQREQHE